MENILSFPRQFRSQDAGPEETGKKIGCYWADSASYQADLFNQLEEDGVSYGIAADQDKAVKKVMGLIDQRDWKKPVPGCGYQIAETVHCMNRTKRAFRHPHH